ncbi:MAG TPA: helical backbone metal receptor [Burkholderiaceae bacterium]|nr:helical backbone metal receptor [Burkholderiaceae bacterium]
MSGVARALAVALAGAAAIACAGAPGVAVAADAPGGARAAPAPVSAVDDRGRTLRLPAPPARIVTLLPSLTETVCALDACDRLVGVDRWSNWPASAAALPRVGGLEDTSIERIVALRPDVVLAAGSTRALARLESLGVPVLALEPRGLADTRRVLDAVASILGRPRDGEALWRAVEARIEAAAARVPPSWRGRRAYVEVSEVPHAAGEASFVGETLARLGLGNVVPASLGPFPAMSPEYLVRAAPELIVADARTLARMAERPGWSGLAALRAGRTCGLGPADWDLLVRPGPRLGEGAERIAACLSALGGPAS